MIMKKLQKQGLMALAITGALSMTAGAQYRVDNGNTNDANNRVGSGGINGNTRQSNSGARFNGVSSTDVVYGNVTGGKEFRGALQSTDPRAFRGFAAGGVSDRFIRGSSSGVYGSNAQNVQAYYGDSRGVAPPSGFERQGYVGGYIPAPAASRLGSDLRLGDVLDSPVIAPVRPGDLMLPGPVDASNTNTMLSASPVYGIRTMRAESAADQDFTNRYNDMYRGLNQTRMQTDNESLLRMRDQLNQQTLPAEMPMDQNGGQTPGGALGANPQQSLGTGAAPNNSAGSGGLSLMPNQDRVASGAVQNNPLPPLSSGQNQPLSANLQTSQGNRVRLLVQAAEQTPELQALQKQYIESYGQSGVGTNDAGAARDFNQMVQALEKARNDAKAKGAAPGGTTPGGTAPGGMSSGNAGPGAGAAGTGTGGATPDNQNPGATPPGGTIPGTEPPSDIRSTPAPTNAGAVNRPKPVQVKSLTGGVKVKEFSDILTNAENNMKQGKWITAIEDYDQARVAAPNNPLILIGRANANLGASYYTKADADLRNAFTTDESLLHGQYDLRTMMGDERIEFVAKDLKEIAKKNPNQSRPYFLLAYVYYNIGEERKASGYLSLAERYAATGDAFYGMVRQHWVLPENDQPMEEQNK